MVRSGFERALRDRRTYEEQLERLHARHQGTGRLYDLQQDGVPLAAMVLDRRRVARSLARSVRSGAYRPAAARRRVITTGNKHRVVYVYDLVDRIVLGVVARLIDQAAAPHRSDRVYSYRAGSSSWNAVQDLSAYVRRERRRARDPRSFFLHVVRRDVTAYTDSIPTGPGAPLWDMVRDAIGPVGAEAWGLVEHTIRPEVRDGEVITRPERGLPLGQPISGVIANLYLRDLDRALGQVTGGFYARYGDDVVFAHTDADEVRRAADTIDQTLGRLGLSANADKDENYVLTPAGRPSPDWPKARPATCVSFLGATVQATGTVGLSTDKARALVRDARARARRVNRDLAGADLDIRGRAVCAAINATLDPASPATHQQRSANLVRRVVTDRGQLRDLDRQLARAVISALTGRSDPRVLRQIPYRRLRDDWGLVSIEHSRNRWGRSER